MALEEPKTETESKEKVAVVTIGDIPPGTHFLLLDPTEEQLGAMLRIETDGGDTLKRISAQALTFDYCVRRFPRETAVLVLNARSDARRYSVADGHEHGTFFVQSGSRQNRVDGTWRYWATFSCVTSYGNYGFHWSYMGCPFAQFVQDVESDYLLSKISARITQTSKICESVTRLIDERLAANQLTTARANQAKNLLREFSLDYSDSLLAHRLYRSKLFSQLLSPYDWTELSMQDYPLDAKNFAAKLWPEFVWQLKPEILNGSGISSDPAKEGQHG